MRFMVIILNIKYNNNYIHYNMKKVVEKWFLECQLIKGLLLDNISTEFKKVIH